ncbi:hypothetical protein [Acinetobacter pittii]|uniref:Uncharacterized protein n=1 Tax=Acinetobacter pittii TaxID=48296 RepID=A0A6S4UMS4_ACIPI|nr:hypothetical protein [Acinetobacter pittii]NMI11229.1 hypothetical protein [Acinetobacter pittii]OTN13832.1 hypothetical protein B9Y18_07545 [Acinetobacter pittii]BBQ49610.1 hypothetical protein WP2W18E11_26080 [Acinetobacter pittii]HBS65600.1 hypothetical protein [Acinetobacter pittii]HCT88611.1 hypothetical protein [Acinetobacter pittii]
MARKQLTLQQWLDKDQTLKSLFLEHECNKEQALLQIVQLPDGRLQIQPIETMIHPLLVAEITNQWVLLLNEKYFSDLKNRFRNFKYSKKNHANVRKQFYLTSHTAKKMEALTEKLKLKTEAECLEFLMNTYEAKQTLPPPYKQKLNEKDMIIEELNQRIKALDKMLYIKQLQVRKQDEVIQKYLINELINSKITINELTNSPLQDASEIQKLKLQFLKEIQKNIQLEQIRHLSVDQIVSDTFGNE